MNQVQLLKIAIISGTLAGMKKTLYEAYKEIKGREPVTAKIIKRSVDELTPICNRLRALTNIKPTEDETKTETNVPIEAEGNHDD